MSIEVTIPAALEGERLDRVVAMLTGLSRAASAGLVDGGSVRVGGVVVTARAARLPVGETLHIDWEPSDAPAGVQADPSVDVPVVFADDHLIVVDKPAGVVVHPGAGTAGGTLVEGLLARFPDLAGVGEAHRPGVVHRLDRGTSGLLVVGRTQPAYDGLVAALAAREVERAYSALVLGQPGSAAGLVDAPVGRSRHDPTRRAVVADGRPARTRYRVVRAYEDPEPLALLRCELETGRTHQIRVHLQAIGHPVVADAVYGGGRCTLGLDRPFLHAEELRLAHPVTGEALGFEAPLTPDLAAVLERLDGAARPGAG